MTTTDNGCGRQQLTGRLTVQIGWPGNKVPCGADHAFIKWTEWTQCSATMTATQTLALVLWLSFSISISDLYQNF